MYIYWEHFLAWLRGDLTAIVSDFEKVAKKLSAHNTYLTKIADNQAQASRSLAKASAANYAEANKANAVAANLTALTNPPVAG